MSRVDGLDQHLLLDRNTFLTRTCFSTADCTAFGTGACCQLPGPQVTTPVCVPVGKGCFSDGG